MASRRKEGGRDGKYENVAEKRRKFREVQRGVNSAPTRRFEALGAWYRGVNTPPPLPLHSP